MSAALKSFVVSGAIFLCLDALWLSSMSGTYKRLLGDQLAVPFLLGPAALFYMLYVAGIVFFAVMPSLATSDWVAAAGRGAFLGLFAYGTYDLTNMATLKFWSWRLTVLDMAWGTLLTALTAALAVVILSRVTSVPN